MSRTLERVIEDKYGELRRFIAERGLLRDSRGLFDEDNWRRLQKEDFDLMQRLLGEILDLLGDLRGAKKPVAVWMDTKLSVSASPVESPVVHDDQGSPPVAVQEAGASGVGLVSELLSRPVEAERVVAKSGSVTLPITNRVYGVSLVNGEWRVTFPDGRLLALEKNGVEGHLNTMADNMRLRGVEYSVGRALRKHKDELVAHFVIGVHLGRLEFLRGRNNEYVVAVGRFV